MESFQMTKPIIRFFGENVIIPNNMIITFSDQGSDKFRYCGRYVHGVDIATIDNLGVLGTYQIYEIITNKTAGSVYMIRDRHYDKEGFLDFVKKEYSEDFEFFLFHLEVLDGKFVE